MNSKFEGELTMAEPTELNEILRSRRVLSVEPGRTPGWMVVNFELNPDEREAQPDMRLFLTVFVGGRKGSSDANHYSTCALHDKSADGCGTVEMIRDGRDPEMPMSGVSDVLRKTKARTEDGNPKFRT
jgi:hypothetical protein